MGPTGLQRRKEKSVFDSSCYAARLDLSGGDPGVFWVGLAHVLGFSEECGVHNTYF